MKTKIVIASLLAVVSLTAQAAELPVITNTVPVSVGTLTKLWVSHVRLTATGTLTGRLTAELVPWDGGTLTLPTGAKTVTATQTASGFAALLSSVQAEAQRQAVLRGDLPTGTTAKAVMLDISAPAPGQPSRLMVMFDSGARMMVADALTLAHNDATFAAVFANVMSFLQEQVK